MQKGLFEFVAIEIVVKPVDISHECRVICNHDHMSYKSYVVLHDHTDVGGIFWAHNGNTWKRKIRIGGG